MEAVGKTSYYGLLMPKVYSGGTAFESVEQTERTSEGSAKNIVTIRLSDGSVIPIEITNGNGIASVEQTRKTSEPSGVNEWTLTDTDGNIHTFQVTNGVGIVAVTTEESDANGGENVVTFTDSEGNATEIRVRNGHGIDSHTYTENGENGGTSTLELSYSDGTTDTISIKNGTDAGFGETTASISTLEPGEEATVSVMASGDFTERNFDFQFAIPKGEKGDTGDLGNIDSLEETEELEDGDDIPTERNGSIFKASLLRIWDYIRSKIDTVLGFRKTDGGNVEIDGSVSLVKVEGSITEKWTTSDFQGGNGTLFGGGSSKLKGFTHNLYIDASASGAKWYERSGNTWSVQVNAGTIVYIPADTTQKNRSISATLYTGTEIETNTEIQTVNGSTYVSFTVTASGYLSDITFTHDSDSQIKADSSGAKILKDLSVGGNVSTSGNITSNGKNVVTSVNGTKADSQGNITLNTSGEDWKFFKKEYYEYNIFDIDEIPGRKLLFVYIADDDPMYVKGFWEIDRWVFEDLMSDFNKVYIYSHYIYYDEDDEVWRWGALGDGYMEIYYTE